MRKVLLFLIIVLVTFSFTPGAEQAQCTVEALFVSHNVDHVIESRIIEALNQAKDSIAIAMFNLTDEQLAKAIITALERDVEIRVILDDSQDDNEKSYYDELDKAGVPVVIEHETGLFHHKFAVVDSSLTITGSYNWTDNADQDNFENVVFISCDEIATNYLTEFNWLWGRLKGEVDTLSCTKCVAELNFATVEDFDKVKGIGKVLAARLITARPFNDYPCNSISDLQEKLQMVEGIGSVKSRGILEHLCPELFE